MMPIALCIPFPFSAQCNDMLIMLVYTTRWLFVHLYKLAYMSMHESCLLVCRSYFNTMKLWTSSPNYICLPWTPPFVCFFAYLPFHLFARIFTSLIAIPIMLICFMPFHMLFSSLLSIACLLVSCLCLCMYTHRVRTSLLGTSKKGTNASMWLSQAVVFNRLRSLAFLFGYVLF